MTNLLISEQQFELAVTWGRKHGKEILRVNAAQADRSLEDTEDGLGEAGAFEYGLQCLADEVGFDLASWRQALDVYKHAKRQVILVGQL